MEWADCENQPLSYNLTKYMIEFLLILVLFFMYYNLSQEIKKLKNDFYGKGPLQASQGKDLGGVKDVAADIPAVTPQHYESQPGILDWWKKNWMLKVGVLLILTGFGWFISYAFVNNWIGPAGRVILGFVLGALCAIFGTYRMNRDAIQSNLFIVLGSAISLITAYAANVVYGFFGSLGVLGITLLITFFVAMCATVSDRKSLALYGIFVALSATVFTHAVNPDIILTYLYLCIVSFGFIWLALYKKWSEVNAFLSLGLALNVVGDLLYLSQGDYFIAGVVFVLGLVYFAVSIGGMLVSGGKTSQADVVLAILNSITIMLAIVRVMPKEWQSLILAFWMLIFAAGSFITYFKTGNKNYFYTYCLVAIAFLGAATAIELQGPVLTIAFCIEAAIIALASFIITGNIDIGFNLSKLMIIPGILAFSSLFFGNWQAGVFNSDFVVVLLVGVLLMVMGIFFFSACKKMAPEVRGSRKTYIPLNIFGSVYLLALVWRSTHAAMDGSLPVLISLLLYSVVGIATYFYGLFKSQRVFRLYGLVLLVLVIARLVLVDVWEMELAMRITTFVLIGLMFIGTAFITQKSKNQQNI